MASFEKECLSGPSFRNRSAGSWCATSNHSASLLKRRYLPRRNLDARILVCSLGRIIEDHCQAHAGFRETRFGSFRCVALINLADGQILLAHALSHVIVLSAA